ncbi:MAG: D-alanyl-D-alanine carboxypeptidase/D-alanyl-D-alanine-endopeptidase, partial [Nitrospinaceae bacterium]|nr:D-alanyl-D-alanine carboxypeptidase/D-alanyl-D-alanine-endopeptidase [Nitrospinaceae bacterium]
TLFSHRAEEKGVPASNMKLMTTAAALAYLGPDYTFSTDVYTTGTIRKGVLKGDLFLKGYGDPTFVQERVRELAYSLYLKGVRQVLGDLIADDSFFDGQRYGKDWKVNGSGKAYLAPYSALSVNFSLVNVQVDPGSGPGALARVQLIPPSDTIGLKNSLKTVSRRKRPRVRVSRRTAGGKDWIHVSGRTPARKRTRRYTISVSDPTRFAAGTFSALLKKEGIRFRGRILKGKTPPDAKLIARQNSRVLGEIIRGLNKHSNNLTAELILKTLGAEIYGLPGTTEKGLVAVKKYLLHLGIPQDAFDFSDGSGLSRKNRITPRAIVTLLSSVYHDFRILPEYLASLAVVGVDGTIRKRLRRSRASRRIRAKTGLLAGIHALSGFAAADNGETLAFSILSNQNGCRPKRLMNRISLAMTQLNRPVPKSFHHKHNPPRQMLLRPMPNPLKRDRWRRSGRARSETQGAMGGAKR